MALRQLAGEHVDALDHRRADEKIIAVNTEEPPELKDATSLRVILKASRDA